jgi:hypothetical protein
MLGSNIDKVGWPKCGRLIFLSMWKRTRYYFYFFTHRDSHGNTINKKKTRIEDIEEGIISMLWIGLKIK